MCPTYRMQEIFGGVKYWWICISLTFRWQNIANLLLQVIWMVKLRHLEGKIWRVTMNLPNSPIFSPSKYFLHTVWPTCDPHVEVAILFKSNVRNMTWKIFNVEKCHRFLYSWQDIEPVLCTDFLKVKSLDSTCFKTDCFLKNMSHPNNLVYGWDPFEKSDPSNPDCPGHLTHFQSSSLLYL